jgi:hypothetical protein
MFQLSLPVVPEWWGYYQMVVAGGGSSYFQLWLDVQM